MQRKNLVKYQSIFGEIGKTNYGEKFNVFAAKNIELINEQYEIYTDWFKENEFIRTPRINSLITLKRAYQQMMSGDKLEPSFIIEKQKEYETIFEDYKEEEEIITNFEKKLDAFMCEDVDINFCSIKEKDIPKELPGNLRFGIKNFIA